MFPCGSTTFFTWLPLFSSTRIMCGLVIPCVTVKIVIHVFRRLKCRSIVHQRKDGRSPLTPARISNQSDDFAVYTSSFPINQTSGFWIALQPVVYVAFDKDLSKKLFPPREVYGVVVCFVQWRICRDNNIHLRVRWPIWSWCDCVWLTFKVIVFRESIAPH